MDRLGSYSGRDLCVYSAALGGMVIVRCVTAWCVYTGGLHVVERAKGICN